MKASISLKLCIAAFGMAVAGSAMPGALSTAQMQQLARTTPRNVIVILRDQVSNVPPERRAMGSRAAVLAASQRSVLSTLPNVGGRKVQLFSTINAFAATVTDSEAAQLRLHPGVQAVVPDLIIKRVVRNKQSADASKGGIAASAAQPAAATEALCNTLEPEALQQTHAAFEDSATPQAQTVRDGNGQPVTGKGVKVAFIADGVDPTLKGFIRPDGSHVFIDYQDFSGDPAGTPTGGGEAFLDSSAIAAQDTPDGKPLTFDISKYVNAAHPLPAPCNIRIRGVAPGASLVGLKVFSAINETTTSNFVQAIEYAVVHDDVDVINESFGGNPYPDNANDPISLANNAAVAAGVTVVVSSGDGGTAGTLGSPATESGVIAAGATTSYRAYAQTDDGIMPLTKNRGYIDNNISPLSSGGFAQKNARTVDVVAPGDLNWALCSTNQTLFEDCEDYTDAAGPTPVQVTGGTSQASPLTSATAALVIQAYRSTHRGADPTPALVKSIIMSTATDLGAPAYEQGAGLINTLAAVNAALSVDDANGRPKPRGDEILASPTSVSITAAPGARESHTFTLTNTGSTTQRLTPTLETLGAPFAGGTFDVTVNTAHGPTFVNVVGATRVYSKTTFTVPAGADHLDVAIAFQETIGASVNPIVLLAVVDPEGRQASYSIPQGSGSGYGHVDVVKPAPGSWTAYVWTRKAGVSGSYSGPVQLTWGVERYVKLGSVSPSQLDLAPGAHGSVTAEFSMPEQPGDSAAALRFERSPNAATAAYSLIPISLRTLIPTTATGGSFTGTLTGGNSRPDVGPTQTFAFDVPAGVGNMSLVLEIPDNGYLLEGLLVDPHGVQLSVAANQDPITGSAQFGMQLAHYNPEPGQWKFVLLQNFTSSGNQTSLPFTARLGFNTAQVAASGLPDAASVKLSASAKPVAVPIQITNTGTTTQLYFADARLSSPTLIELPDQPGCSPATTLPGACGLFFVPTQASTVSFAAQSVAPITMDAFNDVGTGVGGTVSPDVYSMKVAPDTVIASFGAPEVPYSAWISEPSLIGPYKAAGTPTEPVTLGAFAFALPFDPAVSADSGDEWADLTLGTSTFNPLILAPGQTGTITLTVTPDAKEVGSTVTGFVYVDTFSLTVFTGDEVVRLPYSYTIVK